MHILVVQADQRTAESLRAALEQDGYRVQVCHDGDRALSLVEEHDFEIIVLGINLPGTDGYQILQKLHQAERPIPVVVLSRESDVGTRVRAFDLGADDYLIKPCEVEELEARIGAIARRSTWQRKAEHLIGGLRIDVPARRVELDGKDVSLTPLEFKLLEYLGRTPDVVRSRTEILEHVWGYDFNPGTNVIAALVRRLRHKLRRQDETQPIKTAKGVGYRLESFGNDSFTTLSPRGDSPVKLTASHTS